MLSLLQEVAQFPGVKLDWNALVKKTSTGISNAREYQMLWRHLAYRTHLLEKLEDEAQPLVTFYGFPAVRPFYVYEFVVSVCLIAKFVFDLFVV